MSTLSDLRSTLDEHAESVADAEATARLSAVHHRVAVVRRRRRAVGTGAVALAMVAGVAVALWPRSAQEPTPAGPVVLGQRAPSTLHSLGYTYDATGHAQVVHGRGTVVVAESPKPQLLTWTTVRTATVTFELNGEVHRTTVSHFRDFLWLPGGVANRVHVDAGRADVGIATYAVAARAPAGYTRAGVTYRRVVAGADLLAAKIGDEGESSVTTTFLVPKGSTSVGVMCSELPHGDVVNLSFDGHGAVSSTTCDGDSTFDPGSAAYPHDHVGRPGHTVRVRVWISRGFHDHTPVPAGSIPGLRVGVGVYGPVAQRSLGGSPVPLEIEDEGRLWQLATTASQRTSTRLRVGPAPVDRVASLVWRTHGHTRMTFGVESQTPEGSSSTGGPGGMSDLWVPAGSAVQASASQGSGRYGIACYERTD